MHKLLVVSLYLLLAACDNPTLPCLDSRKDKAVVLQVGVYGESDTNNTVKMRRENGTVFICVVHDYRAKMLQRGDVLQGPLDDAYYWTVSN